MRILIWFRSINSAECRRRQKLIKIFAFIIHATCRSRARMRRKLLHYKCIGVYLSLFLRHQHAPRRGDVLRWQKVWKSLRKQAFTLRRVLILPLSGRDFCHKILDHKKIIPLQALENQFDKDLNISVAMHNNKTILFWYNSLLVFLS